MRLKGSGRYEPSGTVPKSKRHSFRRLYVCAFSPANLIERGRCPRVLVCVCMFVLLAAFDCAVVNNRSIVRTPAACGSDKIVLFHPRCASFTNALRQFPEVLWCRRATYRTRMTPPAAPARKSKRAFSRVISQKTGALRWVHEGCPFIAASRARLMLDGRLNYRRAEMVIIE